MNVTNCYYVNFTYLIIINIQNVWIRLKFRSPFYVLFIYSAICAIVTIMLAVLIKFNLI